ncbi:hypothetical protein ABH892_005493, partial [Paenibacillus sp. RC254]
MLAKSNAEILVHAVRLYKMEANNEIFYLVS